MKTLITSLLFLSLIFRISSANSAGFATSLYSASALANSNAGSVVGAHDLSDSFSNSAVLSDVKSQEIVFGLSYLNSDMDDDNATATNGSLFGSTPVSGRRNNDAGDDKAFIPAFYYASRVNDRIVAGLSVTAPFALSSKYNANWVGRYHAIESRMETANFNPTISYEVTDKLALGLGLQAQYMKTVLTKAVFNGFFDSLGKLKADDWGYGYTLGTKYKLSEKSEIGLGYRSKIEHKLEGKSQVPALGMFSDITAKLTSPEILAIGNSYAPTDKIELLTDITWTRWSRVKNLNVVAPENAFLDQDDLYVNYEDSFKYSLGVNYLLNPNLKIKTGIAYEEGANSSSATTSPRIPIGDLVWTSLGFEYKLNKDLKFDASYLHQFYKKTSSNIESTAFTSSLNTNYKTNIDVVSAGVAWEF